MRTLRIALLVLLSLLPIAAHAQDDASTKPLIPAAKKVAEAYAMMKKHPGDSLYEVQYLLAFPHDWATFERVYDTDDGSQLTGAVLEQIYYALIGISGEHPELVGSVLMDISKQSNYGHDNFSDGGDVLQKTIAVFAVRNPKLFVRLYKQLNSVEQKNLVNILSNAENFDGYPEYKKIISNLESSGNQDIADQFKRAEMEMIREVKDNH